MTTNSKSSITPKAQGSVPAKQPISLTRVQRTAILKALADPHRFELLERIASSACPMSCFEVGAALPIAPATLSHHLKELEAAGLIDVQRQGKFRLLKLRPGVMSSLIALLGAFGQGNCDRTDSV